MLKVAVCLSGHMRNFRACVGPLREYVLDQPDRSCDVFIHTWDTLGWYGPNDADIMDKSTHEVEQEIIDLYKPVKLVIEPRKEFDVSKFFVPHRRPNVKPGTKGEHILGMYYKVKACNNLKKDNESATRKIYDVVIRTRPDIFHLSPLSLDMELLGRCCYVDIPGQYGGVNDQFCIASSENMDIYAHCFDRIPEYIKKGVQWRPEPILLHHLRSVRMYIRAKHMHYHLLRPDGTFFKNSGTFRLGR